MVNFSILTGNQSKELEKPKTRLFGSKTVESGAFIRTTYRKNGKRKTETRKFTKNQKKVILGHIGDFEVYVYPYDFPDTVFIGKFPISTKIDSSCINQLISTYNKARNFLNGNYFSEPKNRKAANIRRCNIKKAYNKALSEQRTPK